MASYESFKLDISSLLTFRVCTRFVLHYLQHLYYVCFSCLLLNIYYLSLSIKDTLVIVVKQNTGESLSSFDTCAGFYNRRFHYKLRFWIFPHSYFTSITIFNSFLFSNTLTNVLHYITV